MLELPPGANARIPMQVPVAFLSEPLAAPLAVVRPRLRVGSRMVHGTRLNWELTLADCARQAKLEAARLRVHHITLLQILH